VRLARLVSVLLLLQLGAQALSVITGLVLLRWLTVTQYAQYTVAFGFSTTLILLVDLGLGAAVMPLMAQHRDDSERLGAYMKAALSLRRRLAYIVLPTSAAGFYLLASHHHWSLTDQLALFASIITVVIARATLDYYSLPLFLHGKYGVYYGAQGGSSVIRFAATACCHVARALTGWTASAITSVSVALTGLANRRSSRAFVTHQTRVDPECTHNIIRLALPSIPSVLYVAFQGQITIFLIAALGGTTSIADVGALNRFNQLFTAAAALNAVLIGPRFAKLPRDELMSKTLAALVAAAALGAILTTAAFVFPTPFLLLLGHSYRSLRIETGWYILGGSVGAVAGVLYAITTARRFVWWLPILVTLPLGLAVEVAAAILIHLNTPLHVGYFNVVSASFAVVWGGVAFVYGARRGPRVPDFT
jgi:O-antigen/teichoic acid export membrane protein